jgi:hypothetical protein
MTPGLHDLRHFYASGLIVAGCDVVTVQRALGHQRRGHAVDLWAFVADSGRSDARRRCFSDGVRDVGRGSGQAPACTRRRLTKEIRPFSAATIR